jgi:hypothetical protein
VIVFKAAPAVVAMAARAVFAKSPSMAIVGAMTANAFVWNFVVKFSGLVATAAFERVVPTEERKASLFAMIEFVRFPIRLRVALGTVVTARAAMHVIRHVASDTSCGRAVVLLAKVTRVATYVPMCAQQRKVGFIVVETSAAPAARTVASTAFLAELPAM